MSETVKYTKSFVLDERIMAPTIQPRKLLLKTMPHTIQPAVAMLKRISIKVLKRITIKDHAPYHPTSSRNVKSHNEGQ